MGSLCCKQADDDTTVPDGNQGSSSAIEATKSTVDNLELPAGRRH